MILITGGAGFIGGHLVSRLSARGDPVRVLDDFSTGERARVDGLPRVEVCEGDISDPAAARSALDGVGRVVHLAAIASVPHAEADPEAAARVNVGGTLVLLGESRRAGISAFVHASSCSVYGDFGAGPIPETAPLDPRSVYAATKLAAERHVLLHHRTGGPPGVALRFFNVYGPGQRADSPYSGVLTLFARAALAGERPVIHGDGEQTRDYIAVEDVVDAVLRALDRAPGKAGGQVFNVGTGRPTSVNGIWRMVAAATGAAPGPRFGPPRAGDMRDARADTGTAARVLGFRARTELADGIAALVRRPGPGAAPPPGPPRGETVAFLARLAGRPPDRPRVPPAG